MILRPALIGFSLAVAIVLALVVLPQRATEPTLEDLPPRLYPMYPNEEEVIPKTLIQILKTPKSREVSPGNSIDFQIAIQNTTTDETLHDLIVEDLYDASRVSISSEKENVISQNRITWKIPELEPRQIWLIDYSLEVNEDSPPGSIEITTYVLGEDLKDMSSSSRMATSLLTVIHMPPAGAELNWLLKLLNTIF